MLVSVGKYTIHRWYGISLLEGRARVNHFFFGGGEAGSITRESAIAKKKTHSYSKEVSPLP